MKIEKLPIKKIRLKKMDQEKKKQRKDNRIVLVFLSYLLMLVTITASFFAAAHVYWFGKETADRYWETERFQGKMESRIKKTVPALKEYFQQGTWDNHEMVEIYTLSTKGTGEKKQEVWEKTKSYTCESGAEAAGFQTDLEGALTEATAYYKKREDRFLYTKDPESYFVRCWETQYQARENNGMQRYFAVSRDTMKNWMLTYGILNEDDYYEIPYDAYYMPCEYSFWGETYTVLCYLEEKDRWYYLTGDDPQYGMEKKIFHMPEVVYFPLHSVVQSGPAKTTGHAAISTEYSDGLAAADLFLKDGALRSNQYPKDTIINGESILRRAPFFNLRTVLYEAGKGYYHQRELLRYIDRKMDGYLWNFTFRSSTGEDMEIGSYPGAVSSEGSEGADISYVMGWEFSDDNQEIYEMMKEQGFADLAVIGRKRGYDSMEAMTALSLYSLKTLLFSSKEDIRETIRCGLEQAVFSAGPYCGGIAVIAFLCWLYLMIKLLFLQSLSEPFRVLPVEIRLLIASAVFFLLQTLTRHAQQDGWAGIFIILIFFLDVTFFYFLMYFLAVFVVFVCRSGNGVPWQNFLTIRGIRWIWNTCKEFCHVIWDVSGCKRKTVLLTLGYMVGSVVCIAGGLISIYSMYDYYDRTDRLKYFLGMLFFLVLLLFLQIKAISYVGKNEMGKERVTAGIRELSEGNIEYELNTEGLSKGYLEMAELLPKIRDGLTKAIQKSIQDERMKTELITNVSHDIKTPLTSIINYIDLLKRAKPQGENVDHYLEVLTQKSQRLKQLIEDLVEASKASSGALPLEKRNLDLTELIQQAAGEFQEKLIQKNLLLMVDFPQEPVMVFADGRRMFRILENLLQNVYKYAMEHTRVYLDLKVEEEKKAVLMLRNISAAPLNISEEELTERFVRGEESRTTEGSGLGLSIAKDLTRLQEGEFILKIDGDLFKIMLVFPVVEVAEEF